MESLRGPALDILKSARASDPNVSPEVCLEALEHAFGTAESGEELYFAFRLMQQQSDEKLSDFLRRLEQSLGRVVQRGGLPLGCADKVRLEQLLRGAVASDLMLVNLRRRERKEKPPTFLQLLKEIRTEEEYEASRKQITPVTHGAYKQNVEAKQIEIQHLKSEIKELKSLVAAVVSKPAQEMQAGHDRNPPKAAHSDCSSESEVVALKKQLKHLQQKFTNKVAEPRASVSAVNASKPVATTPQRSFKVPDEHFCYRCGENGHYAGKCSNAENQAKVIKKLIQALKLSKNDKSSTDATVSKANCSLKKSAADLSDKACIPDGLVGPSSLVLLKVNGQPCTALLDSGSQVTIIFEP